jgi:hypothetical protein
LAVDVPVEPQQLRHRSTEISSIAELHIQRSGLYSGSMGLRNPPPSSHSPTTPDHPAERVPGPPELHHSKERHHLGTS